MRRCRAASAARGRHADLHGRRQRGGAFARAKPLLDAMGKTIVHAGGSGNGQAAKICNNMILGVSMIAVSEAFVLAEKLGLDAQKLFDIASKSSGQCWSMTSYCPVPGPVPASPANRDYQAGFTAAMMLKDLKLAQDAARAAGAATPLGAEAAALYGLYAAHGGARAGFFRHHQLPARTAESPDRCVDHGELVPALRAVASCSTACAAGGNPAHQPDDQAARQDQATPQRNSCAGACAQPSASPCATSCGVRRSRFIAAKAIMTRNSDLHEQ